MNHEASKTPLGQDAKLGLALSGGGFRASFFHIGVLARMAMEGLLRHVEVISTVSGGSIIGAYYYLHLKGLFESKPLAAIEDRDYQLIVEQIESDFFSAVKRNLRMSTFADLKANLKMADPAYSRSDRIAELYNEFLYQSIQPRLSSPIQMMELKIQPKEWNGNFHPEKDNVGQKTKVPILLINATTLNTGRNWRFTASWMGEPPLEDAMGRAVDRKALRLRRPRSYEDLVSHQKNFPLGHAVAASACVPGIFHPLAISGLYRDLRVELVDGGVHDNQGIQGLRDSECTHFVVSDASGQMKVEQEPATDFGSVIKRSGSTARDRMREVQLLHLLEGKGELRVAFMHLRKGLPSTAVAWFGPDGKPAEADKIDQIGPPSEEFGVAQRVQDLLSKVRTDLDTFTEIEAYSLMADGYLMSETDVRKMSGAFERHPSRQGLEPERWKFLQIAPWLIGGGDDYLKHLSVAGETALKALRLLLPKWLRIALMLVALAVLLFLSFKLQAVSISIGTLLFMGIALVVGRYSSQLAKSVKAFQAVLAPLDKVSRWVSRVVAPALATGVVQLHLKYIDPIFLRLGEIKKLKPPVRDKPTD